MMIRQIIMILALSLAIAAQDNMGGGGIENKGQDFPCLSDIQRNKIQAQIANNIEMLRSQGVIPPTRSTTQPLLEWPLQAAPGNTDFAVHGISNFVDQNATYPNQLLDYNCGQRTYDLASGYNHRGIDMFTWPFPWHRMDNDLVMITAAAPGTIILKSDGNFDRSCGLNSNDWNAVYIRHSDGSIAWYGHMKKNSPTTKAVGETVILGEYLGIVGSSGSSTGPHLHMELHDADGNLIEPYQGSCNSLNISSWWSNQRPYYDSAVNALMTHSAAPVFPSCPQQEVLNLKDRFLPGETVYTAAYYRDQLKDQISQYTLRQPDGSVWRSWTHASSVEHYSASYWYWSWTLPANAQQGTWQFQVEFEGLPYAHEFTVGAVASLDDEEALISSGFRLSQNYPNPFNPSTTIDYHLPRGGEVRLVIFNALGQEVRELVNAWQVAGAHAVSWDGTAASGAIMPGGIYYYRLTSGNLRETRSMSLVK